MTNYDWRCQACNSSNSAGSRKFTLVSCKSCRYTEFFRGDRSATRNIIDFLLGG